MSTRKAVGIDLGTTFSAVAHIDAYGKPQIIPNSESERITPSVILFDGDNAIVGTLAKNNTVAEPEKIVDFVKREMGKSKEQFHREFNGKSYSAEELSGAHPEKAESGCREISQVAGDRCGHHRAGVFQRRGAHRDDHRGPARRV